MKWLTDPNAWIGLLTLTVLELVLGIDNIVHEPLCGRSRLSHSQRLHVFRNGVLAVRGNTNLRVRSRKPAPRPLQSWRLQKAMHRIEAQ